MGSYVESEGAQGFGHGIKPERLGPELNSLGFSVVDQKTGDLVGNAGGKVVTLGIDVNLITLGRFLWPPRSVCAAVNVATTGWFGSIHGG